MLDARRTTATIVKAVALKTDPTSTKFEITLSCGCRFWEYGATAPNLGDTVNCYARHAAHPAAASRPRVVFSVPDVNPTEL
jgi:hypothetical protein